MTKKNQVNQEKHSITFESAARVFDDPDVMFRKGRIVDGEQRWYAIGAVEGAVLLVVHLYRMNGNGEEENIRIISAREAGERECRVYIRQAAGSKTKGRTISDRPITVVATRRRQISDRGTARDACVSG